MLKTWFEIALWKRVVAAMIIGIAVGLFWGEGAETIKWIGDLFIRAIKMLVVPLIFFSLVSGIAALGDLKKLGNVGGRALLAVRVYRCGFRIAGPDDGHDFSTRCWS